MPRKSQTPQNHYPRIQGAYRSQWLAIDYALRIVRKRLDAYYAEHDVDVRHVWILLEARDTKETQGQIAEALGINLNVMVRVVDDMEKKPRVGRRIKQDCPSNLIAATGPLSASHRRAEINGVNARREK